MSGIIQQKTCGSNAPDRRLDTGVYRSGIGGGCHEEQLLAAAQMAQPLSDFPADGCIAVTDELVVVRLSAQEEPPATDWW